MHHFPEWSNCRAQTTRLVSRQYDTAGAVENCHYASGYQLMSCVVEVYAIAGIVLSRQLAVFAGQGRPHLDEAGADCASNSFIDEGQAGEFFLRKIARLRRYDDDRQRTGQGTFADSENISNRFLG
jgi:hypothetical protein